MADFPAPLDNLITYVRTLHPDGGPLGNLEDAVQVAARLDEQSDALIGHFVDQARASGASWSQIGASMGVSKQAAQKRFVLKDDDVDLAGATFGRFTPRTRSTVAVAGLLAAEGDGVIDAAHLAAALPSEPAGVAALAIHRLGITDDAIYQALGRGAATGTADPDPAALRALVYGDDAKAALRGALKAALRLGHNYIGTEHLLLGVLGTEGDTSARLAGIGLTLELADRSVAIEIAQIMLQKQQAG